VTEPYFPRLLYVGDVPVESTYHGSLLLFRLLERYPHSQLLILEGGGGAFGNSQPDRRLHQVRYQTLRVHGARALRTRFHKWAGAWFSLGATRRVSTLDKIAHDFQPQSVLTVAHGFVWLAAAEFAKRHELPLYLIVHDDWPRMGEVPAVLSGWLDSRFGAVYRQAKVRFCVSPFMVEAYMQRYATEGRVLYPSRAADCPRFSKPPKRLAREIRELTVGFAGSVYANYRPALKRVADALRLSGGKLVIFGPLGKTDAARFGLNAEHVEVMGLLSSREVVETLREVADVLLLPMSFVAADEPNTAISFPSKLTDYTNTGLPLLIFGPEYCSAVRWARDNPGVAEIVSTDSVAALQAALARLAKDSNYRQRLAEAALSVGARYFSSDAAADVFLRAVCRTPETIPA
jgi:glycosyltransferase involved in cell wall biosynthesis